VQHHLTTLQLSVTALPGVILDDVLLHSLKLTVPEVGYAQMKNAPLDDGLYPVTPDGSALAVAMIASVVAVPVAVAVIAEEQEFALTAVVPSDTVPLATVCVKVTPPEGIVVPLTEVVLESAAGICAAVAVPEISVNAGCVSVKTPVPGVNELIHWCEVAEAANAVPEIAADVFLVWKFRPVESNHAESPLAGVPGAERTGPEISVGVSLVVQLTAFKFVPS
jgi:hypothetical protein